MAYEIIWQIPECMIYTRLEGKILPAEVGRIALESYDLIASSPHLVHMVVDATNGSISGSIRDYASLTFKRASNTGWSIIIGNDRIGGLLLSLFARAVGVSFVYKSSLEEALEFLAERDLQVKAFVETRPQL